MKTCFLEPAAGFGMSIEALAGTLSIYSSISSHLLTYIHTYIDMYGCKHVCMRAVSCRAVRGGAGLCRAGAGPGRARTGRAGYRYRYLYLYIYIYFYLCVNTYGYSCIYES